MESLIQFLQNGLKNNKLKLLFLLWLAIATGIHKYVPLSFVQDIGKMKTGAEWGLIALQGLALFLSLVLTCFILYRENKTSHKLKFGIYWDREKNPHCKNCKIPLGSCNDEGSYYCYGCNCTNQIADEGIAKSYTEIKHLL